MAIELIDTHAHLDDEQFAPDRDEVIERARAAGVAMVVAVGTTVDTSRQAIELARRYPIVRPAVGIHPNYAAAAAPDDWAGIRKMGLEPEVVAIGETGLDRFRSDTPFDLQCDYFDRHLALAVECGLPVIIHARDADADVLHAVERCRHAHGPLRGVMHSFTGLAATALRAIELGLFISFAGQLTYSNRKFDALREVARAIPADRLLVETDSPYLAPEPHRGDRNEPIRVTLTAQRLAELRGVEFADLAATVTANARSLFAPQR